jgi:UDP-glucuronate 4-epimerase
MKFLVTGNAGFIGFHVAERLMRRGDSVVGLDNVNDYYDPALKEARLQHLSKLATETGTDYQMHRIDLADKPAVEAVFAGAEIHKVIHLAAQAGVRYSLENPDAYVASNLTGFTHILECCRHHGVAHLTYASTSSVYGANTKMPFTEDMGADHPLQFYAATKRANELMAHAYSHLYQLPTTGLRFFTVYGPWGRPDMSPFKFTKAILEGKPIQLFNNGHHSRDFTYVDDIVEGILRVTDQVAEPDPNWSSDAPNPATSNAPYRIFNIGNSTPVDLLTYVEAIEEAVGKPAVKELLPLQPGDVPDTFADVSALKEAVGYQPQTNVREGVQRFVAWYRTYYKV